MATLEQELMADFASSDPEDNGGDDDLANLERDFGGVVSSPDDSNGDTQMTDEEAEYAAQQRKKTQRSQTGIRNAVNLLAKLKPVLQQINEFDNEMQEDVMDDGESMEESPQYQLLTKANELSTQITDEVVAVHKFIRDYYSVRFPYLDDLVKNPLDYAKTVAIIKNGPLNNFKDIAQSSDNIVGVPLTRVLDKALMLTVQLEAVRAQDSGRDLSEEELEAVLNGCSMIIELDKAQYTLMTYVQSRMNLFAPNLTVLIGSLTAAQLINHTGGLSGLAKTPACNIPPLGSKKATGISGMATNVGDRHQGFLYHSPMVQNTSDKKHAMRIISAKLILAARVDLVHQAPDGSMGQKFKEECERRLDKLSEPPPNKGTRALPTPDDKPSRKRGGRRARMAKAATAMTEIRKAQNRMVFGKEEKEVGYGIGDTTRGIGMMGTEDSGRLRAHQIDPKTRAKLSKKNTGWGGDTTFGSNTSLQSFGAGGTSTALKASGLRTGGVGVGPVGGAGTSSIAFTPVQGLELVDPKKREEMSRKRKAEDDRWFKGGTFTQLGTSTTSKIDAGGFKVPALPAKKFKQG